MYLALLRPCQKTLQAGIIYIGMQLHAGQLKYGEASTDGCADCLHGMHYHVLLVVVVSIAWQVIE